VALKRGKKEELKDYLSRTGYAHQKLAKAKSSAKNKTPKKNPSKSIALIILIVSIVILIIIFYTASLSPTEEKTKTIVQMYTIPENLKADELGEFCVNISGNVDLFKLSYIIGPTSMNFNLANTSLRQCVGVVIEPDLESWSIDLITSQDNIYKVAKVEVIE
jgi:flagellar basal body-associated protein FliL|tara:strand:+ start:217 stop:702 length:486 start_codon:yes stop_codon:yes gene_type:complete